MLKQILNLDNVSTLTRKDKITIKGGNGSGCTQYPASQCSACGGFPQSNGCCFGTQDVFDCLGDPQ